MKAYKLVWGTYDQEGEWEKTFSTEELVRKAYEETKAKYSDDDSFHEYDPGKGFGIDSCDCEWYEIEVEGEPPIPQKPLVYLASPYTHDDKTVVKERYMRAAKKAAELITQGELIFSPIAMAHPMATYGKLPGNWEFWEKFDKAFISCCHKLIVYRLSGWETSKGVQAEIKIAQEMGIPVEYIE